MVDEVQDFSPLELAVLLDATSAQRSVTLAGDTAQAIAPEHGFSELDRAARRSSASRTSASSRCG